MFLSIGAMGNFLGNIFYASPTHGAASGFIDGIKNKRCACADVTGIQLELEEQARTRVTVRGHSLPKRPIIAHAKRPVELGSHNVAAGGVGHGLRRVGRYRCKLHSSFNLPHSSSSIRDIRLKLKP